MTSNNHNNHGQMPFWDFVQSFDPNHSHRAGAGVDHAQAGPSFGSGFPFGSGSFNPWEHPGWAGPWGGPWTEGPWGGRRGRGRGRHDRHHHRGGPESDREEESDDREFDMADTPETMREDGPPGPPPPHPPADAPHPPPHPPHPSHPSHPPHPPHPPHPFGPHQHGHHRHGGPGGAFRRGGRCGRGGARGRHGPPPPYNGPFDFRPLMDVLAAHPLAQGLREFAEQARAGGQEASGDEAGEQADTFVPPVDVFSTEKAYVLHVSLPGAVKEDVGVNWDAEKSLLNVAGVVYRPGNEEFLQSLTSSERKVGMFERSIKLPPAGSDEKEEVDAFSITAKMENGILIVTVPKAEKEWTEVHKIDVD
ncbi:hypothetical protein JX266_010367 [Neoarthrinium moseri]|nr:hypothetical protein JX266_010367 [Neoarthrinium moseri]